MMVVELLLLLHLVLSSCLPMWCFWMKQGTAARWWRLRWCLPRAPWARGSKGRPCHSGTP